jgi:hypothetical protein
MRLSGATVTRILEEMRRLGIEMPSKYVLPQDGCGAQHRVVEDLANAIIPLLMEKMRFEEGDILVVYEPDLAENFHRLRVSGLRFQVPIVSCPRGSVEKRNHSSSSLLEDA